MRWLFLILVACGGKQPAAQTTPDPEPATVKDTRTPIEKRRDAAAEKVADRSVKCAVDEAKRDLAAGKITQQQYDADTKPEIQAASRKDWIKKFSIDLNSYQVRVLEVCNRDATTCDELHDCIQHINDKPK